MHTGLCLSLIGVFLPALISQGQIQFPTHGVGGGGGGGGFNLQRPKPHSQYPRPVSQTKQSGLGGCNCLPKSECPKGLGQLQYACLPKGGGQGICCIPQEGVVVSSVGFQNNVPLKNIPSSVIDIGIEAGRKSFQTLLEEEQERIRKGQFLKPGDPGRVHAFIQSSNTKSSKEQHELALTIALASKEIAKMLNLSPQDSFSSLPQVKLGNLKAGAPQCILNDIPRCDPNSKYRTIDGSCNNLKRPLQGKSETAFSRIRPQLYDDGLMKPRVNGVDGRPLPNVQKASSKILVDINLPDRGLALGVIQWAQFIDHDLTRAPFHSMDGEAIMCCENGRIVSPMHESCFPIFIPTSNGFYNPSGEGCINFVRSSLALNEDCAFGPVEQQNALTHWVDGSMIYGSTLATKYNVADLSTGFLKNSAHYLPPVNHTLDCGAENKKYPCFVGGESRINEQPGLTTMHTLWIREHNRIAAILKRLNTHWGPNHLYEETRRIVIAQVQHITYNEWLPAIIGPSLIDKFGINVLRNGYRTSYNPSVDPRIANEFSTAAFRFADFLTLGKFSINERGDERTFLVSDLLNSPGILQTIPQFVDELVNALTLQDTQTHVTHVTQQLNKHSKKQSTTKLAIDLMSEILQRGRDHAISTYNVMRETFGIGSAKTFLDLQNTTPDEFIKRIGEIYRSVDDIDLWVGGMTERPVKGGILGPTFANIVARQFQVAMNGDRYFYDMGDQAGSFTPAQLQEIRKASIARIYCDNSKVEEMQPLAFEIVNRRNLRFPCNGDTIPQINLEVFKE